MSDRFWLGIWSLITIVVCTAVISMNVYYSRKTELISEMVALGADPIRVACALDSDMHTSSPVCILALAK